ncbi:MAG: YetF domain-containing protein [Thermomonas sp.]
MNEMFQLSAPWWQFVLRAVVIYVLVMVLMRLSGKRAVGQFTPFDLVLVILLGNAVQNGINGGDNSLTGAVIMASTLIALNYLVADLTMRFRSVEKLIEGEAVVLGRNGKVFKHVLRRELVSEHDFEKALRKNNVEDIADCEVVLLETNGEISVVLKQKK